MLYRYDNRVDPRRNSWPFKINPGTAQVAHRVSTSSASCSTDHVVRQWRGKLIDREKTINGGHGGITFRKWNFTSVNWVKYARAGLAGLAAYNAHDMQHTA